MKKFFKWLESLRFSAPFLLSCLPFDIPQIRLHQVMPGKEQPNRRKHVAHRLPKLKKQQKVSQRTGVRHK